MATPLAGCFDLFGQYLGRLRDLSAGYEAETSYLRAAIQAATEEISHNHPAIARQVLEYALLNAPDTEPAPETGGNVVRLRSPRRQEIRP